MDPLRQPGPALGPDPVKPCPIGADLTELRSQRTVNLTSCSVGNLPSLAVALST